MSEVSESGVVGAPDVEAAAGRFAGVIGPSPLHRSERLSERYGLDVWLKREDQLAVRSYKARGAYNLIAQLSPEERERGVVCASAGNHGQGVALACASLGVRARVYLPRTTPRQKRDKVRSFGGEHVRMIVEGDTYDDAAAAAKQYSYSSGATLIPAFDDPRTIAGQGTVVREVVEQLGRTPDAVVVPVGGGGLLAGTIAWLRETHPEVRIIGAEPAGAASMALALDAGRPETMTDIDPFVDGAAVRTVGAHTYAITASRKPRMVAVPEGRICVEMLDLYQSDGIISEPAGALAAAALDSGLGLEPGATVVCVLSGGNNDVSRYAEIVERALVFQGRKHYFLVEFPQEPGALRGFLDDVLGPDDDITLFEYVKRNNRETGPALVGIELGAPEDLEPLLRRMEKVPHRVERVPPDSPLFTFLV
ncbi:L-threonine ammonia-lyase [Saccharopolyspora erythraea NRRL 2338]|uniref:L-threonine dehydratase n=2 Tax=Saccharopolyspora erythraea TaxID=1836 RepID=A4FHV0_SACEN|nr:threonine ammonia-lyase IlvA [Saccharopolyspora erythraea]EQD84284.1 threonine dehydratase [Saccharopolyspora erythraea D]PFG97311.1 L-threonine ammonia-lyase [Saccharopolyspora erythraea NRRL 2338]QRK87499.1 threonine ammonia-lyase IlvA [Saccharopolyspora erythraea]CAM03625.1 threonine dehydratase [Saccharopolyspora erythraea NRRL 2338]